MSCFLLPHAIYQPSCRKSFDLSDLKTIITFKIILVIVSFIFHLFAWPSNVITLLVLKFLQ